MLSGFNTNFRYRGVLFHVQTEDSGLENPHVISHLFHGGNIMASQKRDYSELLAQDDLESVIRELMQAQHKSMLKQLSRGEHDGAIEQRLGADVFRSDTQVGVESDDPPAITEEEPPPPERPVMAAKRREHAATATTSSRLSRVFGDRVVSEKPLDEVVLDYLVENARKRKRQPK